ncbi:regulator of microtubule dynamics protein 2-like [Cimex lectularius]|uniref:Regulator of microtubule dynamics protein 1 n=1 Tax=Cimex lectularius TaxID=79782 RepID=A0A8I6RMI3_CIMLE|nr:regulator of microtubule dynamics protein 2-like [Cimex lectularius]XP_014249274.1 regulator of microtubule dynamics protein 2-like [Cimex lectularius]XP_014249275.1 regulator of microtubule dynamics protein 2-like [Cimex lectularius]XP_014249277.1 regulator of microtubule dynamics protein 2-like [Cimex lectularius]
MSSNAQRISITVLALGTGVLFGAIGVYIYESVTKKNKCEKLKQSLKELKEELKELRKVQKSRASLTEAIGTSPSVIDGEEDEFFDFSNSDDDLNSEDLSTNFKYIDMVLKDLEGDKIEVLHTLLELYDKDDKNCQILWRLAMACYQISLQREGNAKKDYINKGIEYARKSLALDSSISEVHKWYAICVGARAEWQGTRDKIRDGLEFQNHVLKALEITPNDPTLYHLLGRFQYEVAGLPWLQRKAVEAIYGPIPQSTYAEAISSLTKADELALRPWKENKLFIAKCFIELGADSVALEWLEKAQMAPAENIEERKIEEEIQILIKKYQT